MHPSEGIVVSGLGPVAGVLGAVGAVSNISKQKKAATAQKEAIAANEAAARSAAASQYVQLKTAQDFANHTSKVNQMSRLLSNYQADMGMQADAIMEHLGQQQEQFQNAQTLLQAGIQATNERENANALRTQASQKKLQETGAARGEDIDTLNALAGQAAEVNQGLSAGDTRRAAMEAAMAAVTGQGGRSADVLRTNDVEADVSGSLSAFMKMRGISEESLLQLLHVDSIAQAEEVIAHAMAGQMDANATRSQGYAMALNEGVTKDIATTAKMNEAGRRAMRATMSAGNLLDTQSDKSNEIFALAGMQQQANNVGATLSNQLAQLSAQRKTVQSPGLFDYLGAGMQAFTSVAPLFQRGTPTPVNTVQYPHQTPNHLLAR